MSDAIFASVIVPAYNEEKYLARCLTSLQRLSAELCFETIVVDNASTDRTKEIARDQGARVVFEPRRGIARALQTGADAARGEILAFTDADTFVPADWLQKLCRPLLSDSDVVAATGPFEYYDNPTMRFLTQLWFRLAYHRVEIAATRLGRGHMTLIGTNFAVRAEILQRIGGFDTRLRVCVDQDLSRRLAALGRVVFLPELLVYTSARRYNGDPDGTLSNYLINSLGMATVGRVLLNEYPDFR